MKKLLLITLSTISWCINADPFADALNGFTQSLSTLQEEIAKVTTGGPEIPRIPEKTDLEKELDNFIIEKFKPSTLTQLNYYDADITKYRELFSQFQEQLVKPEILDNVYAYWLARAELLSILNSKKTIDVNILEQLKMNSIEEFKEHVQKLLDDLEHNGPTAETEKYYFIKVEEANSIKTYFKGRFATIDQEFEKKPAEGPEQGPEVEMEQQQLKEKLNQLIEQIKVEVQKSDVTLATINSLAEKYGKLINNLDEEHLTLNENKLYNFWIDYLIIEKLYERYKKLSRDAIVSSYKGKRSWRSIMAEYEERLDAFERLLPKSNQEAINLKISMADAQDALDKFQTWFNNQKNADAYLSPLVRISQAFDEQGRYIGISKDTKRLPISKMNYQEYIAALNTIKNVQKVTPILEQVQLNYFEELLPKVEEYQDKDITYKYKNTEWHQGTVTFEKLYELAGDYKNKKIIDAYEFLGINPATPDLVKEAEKIFKKLQLQYHPDKYKGNAEDTAKAEFTSQALNDAIKAIRDQTEISEKTYLLS